jgi:hypothetical protein
MLNLKRNLICGKMTRLNEISVGVEYIIGGGKLFCVDSLGVRRFRNPKKLKSSFQELQTLLSFLSNRAAFPDSV